jgi:hypothetical protein
MLSRTDDGLSNQKLFYRVDYVLYCEGAVNDDGTSSFDELFWGKIFQKREISVHCKSVGSKSDLKFYLNKICKENVKDIIVGMDRDYDDILGLTVVHPQVVYTHGYSWESDVIVDLDVSRVAGLFVNMSDCSQISSEFKLYYNEQSKKLRRIFALDFKYYRHEQKLFNRAKPQSIIKLSKASEPCLDGSRFR